MAPRIDSLSNHRIGVGDPLRSIFVRGSGFRDVIGVQVGDVWAEDIVVDGESIITVTMPHLTAGTTNWVIVHTLDGASPCEGDAQLISVDDITDVPPAALRIDAVVPPSIALGRTEVYWLTGSGLSQVTMAQIGGSACPVESYDDTRLMVTIFDTLAAADDETVELTVFAAGQQASIGMTCTAPVARHEDGWPVVTRVDPDRLGVEGGRIVIDGARLGWVTTAAIGSVACTIESVSEQTVVAVAPPLHDHVGQTLVVSVADSSWASPAGSVTVTVV